MDHKNNQWQWMEAGRILVDYSILDEYAQVYKRKVLDLITLCYNKIVVFDFDGTLVEFKYAADRLLPCKDDDLNEYFEHDDYYQYCKALKTMRFVIEVLFPIDTSELYVLSVSKPNVKEPKLNSIKNIFPEILTDNVYQVDNPDEKMKVLEELHNKHNKDIVFIEDTAKTLLIAEETFPFVKGYHISSLIP